MLTDHHFGPVLISLSELLPFGRPLSGRAISMAWESFPKQAKLDLEPSQLAYAAVQLQLDPEPQREKPIHIQLLRYVYPITNGSPDCSRGLRPDLRARMAQPGIFHPLSVREESLAPRLPSGPIVLPTHGESIAARRRRLLALAAATGVDLTAAATPEPQLIAAQ